MAKPGTGWIPDYPDVRDYKLSSAAIQGLAANVQSKEEISSLEILAQKVSEALNVLEKQAGVTEQDRTILQDAKREIEEKIVGEVTFYPVRVRKLLKVGMADPEVTLMKYYLEKTIKKYPYGTNLDANYKPIFTDSTFDSKTKDQIEVFQQLQEWALLSDGMLDINTAEALEIFANYIDQPWSQSFEMNKFCQKWITLFKESPEMAEKSKTKPVMYVLMADIGKSLYYKIVRPILSGIYDPEIDRVELTHEKRKLFEVKVTNCLEEARQKADDLSNLFKEAIQRLNASPDKEDSDNFNPNLSGFSFDKQLERLEKLRGLIGQYDAKTISGFSFPSFPPDSLSDPSGSEEYQFGEWLNALMAFLETIIKSGEEGGFLIFPPDYFDRLEINLPSPVPDWINRAIKQKICNSMDDLEGAMEETIDPLVNALRQTLMPLGQYGNIEEALEKQIESLRSLGLGVRNSSLNTSKASDANAIKLKQFIQEAIKELNLPNGSSDLFEHTANGLDFQTLSFSALYEIEESLLKPGLSDNIQVKFYLHSFIDRYVANSSAYQHYKKHYKNSTVVEKPQFKREGTVVEKPQLKRELFEIEVNQEQPPPQEGCQGLQNYVQFPIHRSLSKEIREKARDVVSDNKRVCLALPEFVDLSYWCPVIEDQGSINSCTAHAGIALTEYFEKKSLGKYTEASRLFLYKVTRNLMQREGDSGTSVRETMKAMVTFGICPEAYWPYDPERFDQEPTPFCYSFAQNYQALKYFRLDYAGISKYILLAQVKVMLATEFPCMFGFTLYSSALEEANQEKGHIPYPTDADKIEGGHAVVAVGYHDRKVIKNVDGKESEGALLIRNSWGTEWGQRGYGWLPYDYVLDGLTADWWSLLKSEWLQSGKFGTSSRNSTNNVGAGGARGSEYLKGRRNNTPWVEDLEEHR